MATLTGLFTLGRDAETRVTQGGTTVVQLAVAYNYGRKGDDGKKPSQWVRASMFGKQAEALIPYLTKGKQVSLVIRDLHIATDEIERESLAEDIAKVQGQPAGQRLQTQHTEQFGDAGVGLQQLTGLDVQVELPVQTWEVHRQG